jgi:hypothetical protein
MKPKDIFGLGIRLLGLFFLYLGLRAVSPLLDLDIIRNPAANKDEILNDLLPVVFNLVVGLCLLRGVFFIHWAYPESSKPGMAKKFENLPAQPKRVITSEPVSSTPEPALPAKSSGMERADEKLAALVEKPKDGRSA